MRTVLRILALFLAGLSTSACFRLHNGSTCPEDEALHSSIATEFSGDTGVVAGRVVSIALEPLAGSSVTLLPSGEHVATRDDGRFHFGHIAPGDYEITVERVAYGRARGHVRVLPNGGAGVTATLGASIICLTAHTSTAMTEHGVGRDLRR